MQDKMNMASMRESETIEQTVQQNRTRMGSFELCT